MMLDPFERAVMYKGLILEALLSVLNPEFLYNAFVLLNAAFTQTLLEDDNIAILDNVLHGGVTTYRWKARRDQGREKTVS